jgi:hypothetical protein
MKILNSILSGASASLKSWKGILITWLFSLILVSVLAIPFRSALKSAFGNSMITERLAQGLTAEIFTDLGSLMKVIISFFSVGLMVLMFVGFLMNIFLNGGQFSFLSKNNSNLTASEFFRASGRNFWSFLIITLLSRFIINFLTGITFLAPILVLTMSKSISLNTSVIVLSIGAIFSIIVISIMLLVSDYARAWQVKNDKLNCFKALGFGFGETFSRFWSSMPLMLLMLLIQIFYIGLVFVLVSGWMPQTGGAVVLMFIGTQLLFIIKIFLKIWRYGTVTALMEINSEPENIPGQFASNPETFQLIK